MQSSRRPLTSGLLLILFLAGFPGLAQSAQPMRLDDPEPRWVAVRFEISPGTRPDQLDQVYSDPLPAWFEPGDRPGLARIRVAGGSVEEVLFAGQNPKPGSFSDFVWVFDTRTGHVISAEVSGRLETTLDWGFITSRVETEVDVQMGTNAAVGFAPAKRMLGNKFFGLCEDPDRPSCTMVNPSGYDPTRGYVNALGTVSARTGIISLRSFSPLGEALFSELDDRRQPLYRSDRVEMAEREHQVSPPPR